MSDGPNALRAAACSAREAGAPWVLDPVAVGAGSVAYDETIRSLLAFKPAVIRGNASELISLAGGAASGKGVETQARSIEAVPHIMRLAQQTGAVVAVSGATDYVTDGGEVVAIGGGDARLTHVTGAAAASVR